MAGRPPEERLVRVFPRRTSHTPDDALAFVGDPPLWLPADVSAVHVSCTFTWDRPEAERIAEAWERQYPGRVTLSGPAYGHAGGDFTPGLYVRQGITFTSRGCPRHCCFCQVPARAGPLRLLDSIPEGHIVQDNNFLACPPEHRRKVYAMLGRQKRAAVFAGGIDARLVTDEIADEFRAIRVSEAFLACDSTAAIRPLYEAAWRLRFLGRRKLRCYVLIGFSGELLSQAEKRLEAVWEAGCLPFAQLYRSPEGERQYDLDWLRLQRKWARPAAMFASHRVEVGADA